MSRTNPNPPASPADPVAVSLLERARRTGDELAARLLLAAAVERVAAGVGLRAVVTGGTAVDFYAAGAAGTSAGYPDKWRGSADLDVVVLALDAPGDRDRLSAALERDLGMKPLILGRREDGRPIYGRGLEVPGLGVGVELVGDTLNGDPRAERVYTVEIEGEPVILRGPEDVVLAYAESGWDTWQRRDWERALAVFSAMRDEIDLDYLRARAAARGLPGVLALVESQTPLPQTRRALF